MSAQDKNKFRLTISIILGLYCTFAGGRSLFAYFANPNKPNFNKTVLLVPFVILLMFGIFLTIKTLRDYFLADQVSKQVVNSSDKNFQAAKPDALSMATKTTGALVAIVSFGFTAFVLLFVYLFFGIGLGMLPKGCQPSPTSPEKLKAMSRCPDFWFAKPSKGVYGTRGDGIEFCFYIQSISPTECTDGGAELSANGYQCSYLDQTLRILKIIDVKREESKEIVTVKQNPVQAATQLPPVTENPVQPFEKVDSAQLSSDDKKLFNSARVVPNSNFNGRVGECYISDVSSRVGTKLKCPYYVKSLLLTKNAHGVGGGNGCARTVEQALKLLKKAIADGQCGDVKRITK